MFKYIRFYLKNPDTGELKVKYICKDCGKEMSKPKNYRVKYKGGIPDPSTATYQCNDCRLKELRSKL